MRNDKIFLGTLRQVVCGVLIGPTVGLVAYLFDVNGYSWWQPSVFSLSLSLTILGWVIAFGIAVRAIVLLAKKDKRFFIPLGAMIIAVPIIMYITLLITLSNL